MSVPDCYLGDAVMASFDGWQIWLTTIDGNNQRIALEPEAYKRLTEYVAHIKQHYAEEQT